MALLGQQEDSGNPMMRVIQMMMNQGQGGRPAGANMDPRLAAMQKMQSSAPVGQFPPDGFRSIQGPEGGRSPNTRGFENEQGAAFGMYPNAAGRTGEMNQPMERAAPQSTEQELEDVYSEKRSYKGPDIPLDQLPTGPEDPYEAEHMFSDLPPSVKRRHDTFKMRNKGEGPATDSEYDNETQTTEEELEDVHSQMDKEAGIAGEDRALGTPPLFSGDLAEDLTVFDELDPEDLTSNDIELFIHLHGKDALPKGYFD
jgi:hypothetical protein